MTLHQKFSRPGYEFHPELGYLCPSGQLRQNVRVGLAAALFGIVAGVAATAALLPRRSVERAWSEPVLAAEPAGPARDSTPLTVSSSSIARTPSATAARVSTDGVVKQPLPAAPISPAVGPANVAFPTVETPARAAPVTIDRGTAAPSASEQVRTVARKRTKTANSSVRRRGHEALTPDAFATSPFGFQTGRFADDTRSGRRRDWGDGWRW
jgi:hypothetical protein